MLYGNLIILRCTVLSYIPNKCTYVATIKWSHLNGSSLKCSTEVKRLHDNRTNNCASLFSGTIHDSPYLQHSLFSKPFLWLIGLAVYLTYDEHPPFKREHIFGLLTTFLLTILKLLAVRSSTFLDIWMKIIKKQN